MYKNKFSELSHLKSPKGTIYVYIYIRVIVYMQEGRMRQPDTCFIVL